MVRIRTTILMGSSIYATSPYITPIFSVYSVYSVVKIPVFCRVYHFTNTALKSLSASDTPADMSIGLSSHMSVASVIGMSKLPLN